MVQVRGHYEDAHRTLQAGTVTLTPSSPISNGTTIIAQVPVAATIVNGDASVTVAAADDTGTLPTGMVYQVTETLDVPNGPPLLTKYNITVKSSDAAAGIDLATATRVQTPVQYTTYLTQASADARYPLLTRSARSDLGIYIPPGWGTNWKNKLAAAKAGTSQAVMATIGSSSTQGYYASNLRSKGWVDLLRANLQATYGDGGSGFRSSSLTSLFQSANGVPAAATTAYTNAGNLATLTGTWTAGAGDYGPGAYFVETTAASATYTVSVYGTTARIFTLDGGYANWTYAVDGGAPVTVADSLGTANIRVTNITGLTAGSAHQIVVTYAGDTVKKLSVCGIAGENASGVIVNNLARYGSRAYNYAEVDQTLGAPWMAGGSYPADLVILAHAPNEAVNNSTGDSWARWQNRIMNTVREARPDADLMMVLPHTGKYDVGHWLYQDYAARARGMAESYGAALIDMWTIGKNSWNYWNTLGYWGNSASPGATGTDNIHPGDTGHAYISSVLLPILS
jgi:lysophospholipase L1-like esterase